MSGWPVEIDGDEFHPIPESWIEHGRDNGEGRPRLYAVSAAVIMDGRALRIRYAHPRSVNVLQYTVGAVENGDGSGYIPAQLPKVGENWARSIVPYGEDPQDVLRSPESDHMRSLWGPRVDDVPTDEETQRTIADGCGALTGVFDDA